MLNRLVIALFLLVSSVAIPMQKESGETQRIPQSLGDESREAGENSVLSLDVTAHDSLMLNDIFNPNFRSSN